MKCPYIIALECPATLQLLFKLVAHVPVPNIMELAHPFITSFMKIFCCIIRYQMLKKKLVASFSLVNLVKCV
jgi:hypothetical protein